MTLACWPAGHEVAYTIIEYLIMVFSFLACGFAIGFYTHKLRNKKRFKAVKRKMSEKVLCKCGKMAVQNGMCEDCFGNWEAWQDELREEALKLERCR